jgi:hypothetical protein
MREAPEPLTCSLRLLFDGRTDAEIGAAVWAALPDSVNPWVVLDQWPVALPYGWTLSGFRDDLNDMLGDGYGNQEDEELAPEVTDEMLLPHLKSIEMIDYGDVVHDVVCEHRDGVIEELREKGLIRKKVTTEVTP